MGSSADGGKGSKGRAANGDRPVGAASCRRDHHTKGVMPQGSEVPSLGTFSGTLSGKWAKVGKMGENGGK